jgi:hypothetical protein
MNARDSAILAAAARRLCFGDPAARAVEAPSLDKALEVDSLAEVPHDSRPDTLEHIRQVQDLMHRLIGDLTRRATVHDQSKLASPERETFDEYTPKLKATTYGSDEYRSYLEAMRPALAHHYAANSHHPEHYTAGIRGMSLMDLNEMLMDWWAASKRHTDGDIRRSIEVNQARFGYSDDLKQIFLNTIDALERMD